MPTVSVAISPIENQHQKLLRFEKRHNLKHNPIRNLYFLAQRVVKLGHCPCKPERKRCPCGQALKEIDKMGHCLCWEFFSPGFDYYKDGN